MTRYQSFYDSKAWRRLSKAFLTSKFYVCECCQGPAALTHHRQPLTPENINNPEITLNADLLQALCVECHNNIHKSAGGAVVQGLTFDENGNLREGN